SLRRYLKEAENASDVDIVDPSVLRTARNQLHQSVGVLELVGLGAPAALLRAAEAALQKLSARPRLITLQAVHTLEHGSFAVLEFIARKLAGKPVAVLALFPQYRALQELAGAPRVHPADLWPVPWAWHSLPADPTASPRHADAAVIARIETDLLALMRSPVPATAARMSELFAALGAGASGRLATLWQLAAAFFEAQSDGLVTPDVYNKRIGSRLLSQLRAGDGSEPSERLAHDLLFFCSQARRAPGRGLGPRLQAVHAAWALPVEAPVDLDVPQLGRFDPAWVAQARKRISSAKEVWSAVAGGDVDRLGTLAEQFSLVADSLQRLYTEGAVLGRALQAAAAHAVALGTEPPAELAMEVATALLYLDASVDDGEFDHPDTAQRIQRLAQRIDFVRQGREPGPLELWMEDLYRRVSDRQTMGSVVQELRASLSEVEKHIDQYFRNPAQREVLIPVPAQLSAMRGVLSVLGLDQASAAVLRMRDDVDALANTEGDPQQAIAAGTFDRLADNLGALSFLIDMVSVQPQMAKSLFRFDPAQGLLSAVVAREDRPTGFDALDTGTVVGARDTDALAVTLEFDRIVQRAHQVATTDLPTLGSHGLPVVALPTDEVTLRLQPMDSDFSTTSLAPTEPLATVADAPTLRLPLPQGGEVTQRLAMSPDEVTQRLSPPLPPLFTQDLQPTVRITPPAPAPASAPAAPVTTGLEDDAEMREIFLEEAREVLDTAGHSLHTLRERHDDTAAMTTVRRAFHTLKGSARMVGLRDFGEAAWACEQLFNARLAEHAGANADLLAFSDEACDYFAGWVEAVAAGDVSAFHPGHLVDAAERLRTGPRAESSPTTPGVFHPSPVELPVAAADLVLAPVEPAPADAPLADAAADADVATTTLTQRVPELPSAADLDLSSWGELDAPAPAVADELQPQELLPELLDTAAPPTAEAVELTLPDFDLAALEDSAATPAAPLPVGDSAELLEATTPLPVAEVSESADIDLLLETALADAAADGDAPAGPDGAVAADIDLDLPDAPLDLTLPEAPAVEAAPVPAPAEPVVALQPPAEAANDAVAEAEAYKQIGPLRISIPLFNIYLNEADELSRRLGTALAEWALELHRPVGEATVALAHSLAGNSATVGYAELSGLARHLEHALERTQARQRGTVDEAALYNRAADEIRRLLHLFAAGFLNPCDPALLQALHDIAHAAPDAERADDAGDSAPLPLPLPMALGQAALLPLGELAAASPLGAAARDGLPQFDDEIDAQDAVDAELFPIFDDEAQELLLQLQARLRDWSHRPADAAAASACMRSLHTFKGGARLAGAMRLGELAHRLESAVEHLAAQSGGATASAIEQLLGRVDTLQTQLEVLRHPPQADEAAQPTLLATPPALPAAPAEAAATAVPAPVAATEAAIAPPLPAVSSPALPAAGPTPAVLPEIDWQRFGAAPVASAAEQAATPAHAAAASGVVRVRAPLLDRLVNQAGEGSDTRARNAAAVHQKKSA
ncbi:MAG: hybrid sensor histidine kinase/response regulator, partial [Burkholderiales bacterium PBB5]